MALETGTYISDLVSTNPASGDNVSQGDDHIRLLKSTVKQTFPNISGAVTPTHTQINNALADFVEGTFTPVISGTTAAGTGTYTTQTGVYSRVADVIFFTINLVWTEHTGTGNMRIDGLPVAGKSGVSQPVTTVVSEITVNSGNILVARVSAGQAIVALSQSPTGGGVLSSVPMDTAGTLQITGLYFV